jgi:hypothetical protein
MATDCITQITFGFDKLVVATFDAEHTSSDGGAVLLKALDQRLAVTEAVAARGGISCRSLTTSSTSPRSKPAAWSWRQRTSICRARSRTR